MERAWTFDVHTGLHAYEAQKRESIHSKRKCEARQSLSLYSVRILFYSFRSRLCDSAVICANTDSKHTNTHTQYTAFVKVKSAYKLPWQFRVHSTVNYGRIIGINTFHLVKKSISRGYKFYATHELAIESNL